MCRFEEKAGNVIKARSELERARMKNPKNADLWLESVRIEARSDTPQLARERLARGLQVCTRLFCRTYSTDTCLQECPNAGVLWAEAIWLEPRPARKMKSVDALRACEHDPNVLLSVSK